MSVTTKRITLVLTAIIFGIVSYFLHLHTNDRLMNEGKHALESILEERSQQLKDLLDQELMTVRELSQSQDVVHVLDRLRMTQAAESAVSESTSDLFNVLTKVKSERDYLNISLVTTKGDIVFSLENTKTKNLLEDRSAIQAQSFVRARMALTTDISELGYFHEIPSYFIVSPVLKGNVLVGFVSAQVNTNTINKITTNLNGLGKAEEVILVKQTDHTLLYVAPTRKNKFAAFKEVVSQLDKKWPYIVKACQGEKNEGTIAEGAETVLVMGKFIPKLNLGLVVKRSAHELQSHTGLLTVMSLLAGFISVCALLVLLYTERQNISGAILRWARVPQLLRRLIIGGIAVNCVLIAGTLCYQHMIHKDSLREAINAEQKRLTVSRQLLNSYLLAIANIGHSIAEDLKSGRLKKTEIENRIKRDLTESGDISGVAVAFERGKFDENHSLYAPYFYREGQEIKQTALEALFDYTSTPSESIPWYSAALKDGALWTRPYQEVVSKNPGVSFAVPFYSQDNSQKPLGVVSVFLPVASIKREILRYDTGETGDYVLLTKQGQYLYHRDDTLIYTNSHKTLREISQESENTEFGLLGKAISEKSEAQLEFYNSVLQRMMWLSYVSTEATGWLLGKTHTERDFAVVTQDTQKEKLVVFAECIALFLLLSALLGKIYTGDVYCLRQSFILMAVVLLMGNFVLWGLVNYGAQTRASLDIPVTDDHGVTSFVLEQHKKSELFREQKVIPIPTGFFINAIELEEDKNKVLINAQVWQELDMNSHKESTVGFSLPQASRLTVTEVHREVKGSKETRVWDVKAELFQQLSHKDYPFDLQKIRISLEPKDAASHYILVPHVASYHSILPEAHPGIASEATVPGFSIVKSYFTFSEGRATINYGIAHHSKMKKKYVLNYDIVLKRSLINSVVIHVVPIFVTLMVLFATILLLHKWSEGSLGVLTALMFTIVLVHRNMRSSLGVSEELLYLEYMLFTTYCMLLFSIVYVIVRYFKADTWEVNSRANVFILSLFWPINFILWILSTCFVFFWF